MNVDSKLSTLAAAARFDVCGCGTNMRSETNIDPTRFIYKAADKAKFPVSVEIS